MYKAGQILTIGKRRYRIAKCKPYQKCVLCKQNTLIPCITFSAIVKHKFNMGRCWVDVPKDCYLKEIKPNASLGEVSAE